MTNYSQVNSTPLADESSTPPAPETVGKDSPSPQPNSGDTRKPSVVSDAWMAGFLDGEGHFAIERTRDPHGHQYYYPRIKATSTNRRVLECLKLTYGGNISTTGRKKSGSKQGYRWSIGGEKAYAILRRVYRHLQIKRPAAALLGKFIRYKRRPSATYLRMALYKRRLHAINRRGD